MMPEVPFEKFRVGSQFFVVTRKHALVVIKDRTLWRKFKLPCYREDECFPEEHYFPTLLSMADPNGCTHYTLTKVNWTAGAKCLQSTTNVNPEGPKSRTNVKGIKKKSKKRDTCGRVKEKQRIHVG
nr:hypothetical protein CFP56_01814 [Quercus suber]